MTEPIKEQKCTKCGRWKPATPDHFYREEKRCKDCREAYRLEYSKRPGVRRKKAAERKKWANSPKGKAWLKTYNREQKRKQRARESQSREDNQG